MAKMPDLGSFPDAARLVDNCTGVNEIIHYRFLFKNGWILSTVSEIGVVRMR